MPASRTKIPNHSNRSRVVSGNCARHSASELVLRVVTESALCPYFLSGRIAFMDSIPSPNLPAVVICRAIWPGPAPLFGLSRTLGAPAPPCVSGSCDLPGFQGRSGSEADLRHRECGRAITGSPAFSMQLVRF
jgi:hypothetical protein